MRIVQIFLAGLATAGVLNASDTPRSPEQPTMKFESFFVWDGGSRALYLRKADLEPLVILVKNPLAEPNRSNSVLCGTEPNSLIIVPPRSLLESILHATLAEFLKNEKDASLRNDIEAAMRVLDNRIIDYPVWKGMSDIDKVRDYVNTYGSGQEAVSPPAAK
jgi:hypothetical protein